MDFKIGDKIILKKEKAAYAKSIGYPDAFTKEILEIEEIDSKNMYTAQNDLHYFRQFRIGGTFEFRLATDNELKLDKIKKMFINKEIV